MRSSQPQPATVWSRADLHIHTTFSDGVLEPEDVLNYCSLVPGLSVIAITDHDTIDGARRAVAHRAEHLDLFADIDVIVGEEISTRDGHVIGLFLEHWIPPDLSAAETIDAIHEQGGLAVAAHPYTHLLRFTGLVGVGDLIHELPFDAVEARNANFSEVLANVWSTWASRGHAQLGSSDAHFLAALGRCYTRFPGGDAEALRRAIAERTTVAAGHCYGPMTLARYFWQQWRAGRPLLPNRHRSRHRVAGGSIRYELEADYDRDALHLTCSGQLNARTAREIKPRLRRVLERGLHVVLDLADVTAIDSAGITVLVAAYRTSSRTGREFIVRSPSPVVRAALHLAELGRIFTIAETAAEADAYLDACAASERGEATSQPRAA